jgi:hypothetical protein
MAGTTIFPTIPNPGATPAGMSATVQALMQCVNLLIVNAQAVSPPSNLAGSNKFAKTTQLQGLALLQGPKGDPGPPGVGFADAPSDGNYYSRVNATWGMVLPISGGRLTGGLSFHNVVAANPDDTTQHIELWVSTPSPFGFSITSGRLNYVVGNPANTHFFRVGGADRLSIGTTINMLSPAVFNPLPINATDDATAATAGVPVGGVYRNGSQLMVRVT